MAPLDPRPSPVLDEGILARLEEDVGLNALHDICESFIHDVYDRAERLRQAQALNDVAALRELAHSVKSAAATFGALRLAESCHRLEGACRSGLYSDALALAEQCLDAAGETMLSMQSTCDGFKNRLRRPQQQALVIE